jgi:hypothetical protein
MGSYSTLLPLDQGDFAVVGFSLARHLEKQRCGKASNSFLIALTSCFGSRRRYDASITSSTFQTSIAGFLARELGPHVSFRVLEAFQREGKWYSFVTGWYVTPHARLILRDKDIDGLMLDTTWRVLRQ